ncbi:MAG: toll/interleukin-1 receptor domain-containing protein [Oscillospiraceae bacterium]|nr:toll/interleukin-1 receptor domain-containing protein [Oscillospiraceae bacterium]
MNAFERLSIEFEGLSGTIRSIGIPSDISNYLYQLACAIDDPNYEVIVYCLTKIDEWYTRNIVRLKSTIYVDSYESNKKMMLLVKDILQELKPEDCLSNKSTGSHNAQNTLIFISHKSDDKKYGDALRDFIIGLGVKDSQLIYTSHPLNKIPMDANIYDYLREHINSKIFMIFLWSDKYLESPACMNEMGAAWVTQADYTNIYVPDFSFGNPKYHMCAVDTRKMGALLNGDQHCKASMIELKNKIQSLFDLQDDEQKSSYLLDEFIKAIT